MTVSTLSGPSSAGKPACSAPAFFPIKTSLNVPAATPKLPRPVRGVSHDELAAALTKLGHFGDRLEVGDLATVICESRNPTAMMRAIADAGCLTLDVGAFGDAHLSLRRTGR
jgi:hypothetical protein